MILLVDCNYLSLCRDSHQDALISYTLQLSPMFARGAYQPSFTTSRWLHVHHNAQLWGAGTPYLRLNWMKSGHQLPVTAAASALG